MDGSHERLRALARAVADTAEEELNCEQILDALGPLVELTAADQPIPNSLSMVQQHLAVCPDCMEEFELLVELARGDLG